MLKCVSLLWNEWVTLSWVQWVDVTVCVVEGAVPEMLGQLESNLPLRQSHFLPMPDIHLTAKVKHQNLHNNPKNRQDEVSIVILKL